MVFSPQQVKFEFLSYIKEFGTEPSGWRIGSGVNAETALFEENGVDRERDIWLWKPLLSPAAAAIVLRYMTEQLKIPLADTSAKGPMLYLFRRNQDEAHAGAP